MSLKPQDRLGPYEILGPIGAGGMGEVYMARDTRLDRTVAVKRPPLNSVDRLFWTTLRRIWSRWADVLVM